jgi:addiction module RelE/StbE family toxin
VIVRWTRRALGDLQRVADHIGDDNPLAAVEFAAAAQDRASRLQRFPLLGRPGAVEDTRELVVHRNDILTYRVRAAEVQVLQLWHVARDRPRGPRDL